MLTMRVLLALLFVSFISLPSLVTGNQITASATPEMCSTAMAKPNVVLGVGSCGVGKTCNYKLDQCKDFSSTASGTCLNDNRIGGTDDRPPLLESNQLAIFKLSVAKPTGSTGNPSPRNKRCGLPKNEFIEPNDIEQELEKPETKLARAAAEILDAIFWLSDLQFTQGICQYMMRFTISIAQMSDGEIYLAGNINFNTIVNQNPKSKWKTFMLDEPGVQLAILYILKKWDFSTNKVFVLKTKSNSMMGNTWNEKEYMRRHAEMQLVRFTQENINKKTIMALGVSKPPCCLCDKELTEGGTYGLANTMAVFSGPGTMRCGVTAVQAPWCGHQYGAHVNEQDPASWRSPGANEWQKNEYDVTKISL